jgi:hypothetical protein
MTVRIGDGLFTPQQLHLRHIRFVRRGRRSQGEIGRGPPPGGQRGLRAKWLMASYWETLGGIGHWVRYGVGKEQAEQGTFKRYFVTNVNQKMRFKRNFPTCCSHRPGA